MSQNSFFKILAFLGLVFIPIRSLLAIAPHKTGAQVTGETSTYEAFWTGFGVTCIAIVAISAYFIVQGEKTKRYDQ